MADGQLGIGTYAGPANRGLAQVLGRSLPKPFELLSSLGAQQARKSQAKAAAQTKQRGQDMAFWSKNIDANFEPLKGDLNIGMGKNTAAYMDIAAQTLSTAGTPGFKHNVEKMLREQNNLRSTYNTAQGFSSAIEDTWKVIGQKKDLYNEGVVSEQLGEATRDAFLPDGKLNPNMSTQQVEAVFDNPDAYNTAGVVNNVIDQFETEIVTRKEDNPTSVDVIKEKGKLLKSWPTEDGGRTFENPSTGYKEVNDSNEAFGVVMGDKPSRLKIEQRTDQEHAAGNTSWTNRDSFRAMFTPQLGIEQTMVVKQKPVDLILGRRPSGGAKAITDEDLTFRNQINTTATQPFGSGSQLNTPSPQAQSVMNDMKGGTIGGMTILDVEAVKGGQPSEFDEQTKEYDRYVFKVKGGTRKGKPTETNMEINLTEPNYGTLHGIFNTSPNIQKRIPLSKQVDFNKQFEEEGPDLGF